MDRIHPWTAHDITPQVGRLAVVTGSTQGIGYHIALELARAGADVIIPARSLEKGRAAIEKINRLVPAGCARCEILDLASLSSIRAFATTLHAQKKPLHLLVNNAAVVTPLQRRVTEDGLELQFQTNYLGAFALTALLLPLLREARGGRVTSTGSLAHHNGRIDFDDLQGVQYYNERRAYSQSKLAGLLFTMELQRRSDSSGWQLMSNAGHPGLAVTNLMANGRGRKDLLVRAMTVMGYCVRQRASIGALPMLYAATSPDAQPMAYYGPAHRGETRGPVAQASIAPLAKDENLARKLWEISQHLSGVSFPNP
jgi:NAD(P)-dependent dehydrogenase (short-subunit alcohol dehydrogenase family)